MARIAWLARNEGTQNGFLKVEIVDEGTDFRLLLIKEGEQKDQQLVIPGKGIPYKKFHPALYEQKDKPDVFWFKGRSLQKVDIKAFRDPEAARLLIPVEEAYKFPPHTVQVIDGILAGDHTLLIGHKGSGKTSIVMQIAARIGQPVVRTNFTGHTTLSDLVGTTMINKEGTYFSYGPVMSAMRDGLWFLADEFDFGEPRVLSMFHSILEKRPAYCLKENNGEVITATPTFRFFATANSIGGDKEGLYAGTETMNSALLDRFSGHGRVVHVLAMTAKQERDVLKARMPNLPKSLIRRASDFAAKVRVADKLPAFSTRELLNWCCKMVEYKDAVTAAQLTFLPVIQDAAMREAIQKFVELEIGKRLIVGRAILPQGHAAAEITTGEAVRIRVPKPAKQADADAVVGSKPSEGGKVGKTSAQVVDVAEMAEIYATLKCSGGDLSYEKAEEKFGLRKANGTTAYRIARKYEALTAKAEGQAPPEKDEKDEAIGGGQ